MWYKITSVEHVNLYHPELASRFSCEEMAEIYLFQYFLKIFVSIAKSNFDLDIIYPSIDSRFPILVMAILKYTCLKFWDIFVSNAKVNFDLDFSSPSNDSRIP